MSAYVRLAAIALALLIPAAVVQLERLHVLEDRTTFDSEIPATIGEWKSVRDSKLDPDSVALLEPKSYAMRLYSAPNQPPIWAYVAFYSGGGELGAHDPAVCYPAQGWSISEQQDVRVDLGGESLTARYLRTELSGAEELVLYWFQPAQRWPGSARHEYFLRVLDNVIGRPQYAFVRLSLRRSRSARAPSGMDLHALRSLGAAIAPWVREAVSSPLGGHPKPASGGGLKTGQ